ncbi:MAG TPA: hypothetical protein PLV87_14390 [Opitutaceae bacterium]|nr:hypothetical protein [Opitutaceae bacterium]
MTAITVSDTKKPGFIPVIQQHGQWIFADRRQFEARVTELEGEGMTTSDAQGAAEAEVLALAERTRSQEMGRPSGIHTLTDLARAWFESRRSIVHEFDGSISEGLRGLRDEAEMNVNPLLVAHGADPLDVATLLANDFLDEEE